MKIGFVATGIWQSGHLEIVYALSQLGHQVQVYTEDQSAPHSRALTHRREQNVDFWFIHTEQRNPKCYLFDKLFKPLTTLLSELNIQLFLSSRTAKLFALSAK